MPKCRLPNAEVACQLIAQGDTARNMVIRFRLIRGRAVGNFLENGGGQEIALNIADVARDRLIAKGRTFVEAALPNTLASFAAQRAAVLEQDHLRLRTASGANLPRVTVEPVLPPDVIGFFVLLPSSTEGN
jgi:hypothetical protein